MAEQEQQGQEKTEEPTAKRVEDAKKKGEIARSRELAAVLVMLVGSIGLWLIAANLIDRIVWMFRFNFSIDDGVLMDNTFLLNHLIFSIKEVFIVLIPWAILLFCLVILAIPMVGGFNLSFEAIMPKLSKLSPKQWISRTFSWHSIMEALKAVAKFLLIFGAAIMILYFRFEDNLTLTYKDVDQAIVTAIKTLGWALVIFSMTLLIIVFIDVPFQLHQHHKKMKMTKQEVKDEMKDTEGKPEVKSKQRSMQREIANRQMLSEVPDADVVITNPTHFAVAIKYDMAGNGAPIMIAKAVDLMAQQVQKIALANDVMIVQIPPLARSIYYHTEVNQEIPYGLYYAVAQVLAYVYQVKEFQHGRGDHPGSMPSVEVPDELKKD